MAQNAFRITKPGYSPTSDPLQDLAAITGYRPEGEDDSFAIDLERELMGAVDAPNGQRSLASELEAAFGASGRDEPLPQPVNDDDFMASFADEIGAGLDDAGRIAPETGFVEAEPALQAAQPHFEEMDFSPDAEIDLDFGDLDFSAEPVAEAAAQTDFGSAQPDFEAELLAFATGAGEPAPVMESHSIPAASADSPPFFDVVPEAAEPVAEMQEIAFDEADFADEAASVDASGDWHADDAAAPVEDDEPVANWSAATHPQDVWQDEPAETAAPVAEPEVPASDPFAELARLAASYSAARPVFSRAPIWANRKPEQAPVQPAAAASAPTGHFEPAHAEAETPVADFAPAEISGVPAHPEVDHLPAAADSDALDFDIVELPEEQVALADDLDLPDVSWGDEPVATADYDDYDDSYNPAYVPAAHHAETGPVMADDPFGGTFEADFERELALEQGFSPAIPPMPAAKAAPVQAAGPAIGFDDFAVPARAAPPSGKKPMLIAAAVAGIALIGAIGVYAMSGKTSGTAAPAVVKADDAPVKVKPENPGGTKIGNQDSAVYEKVAGAEAAAPAQEKLVTTAEEPVEIEKILPAEQAALPEAKGEDRIVAEEQADPAIAPETVAVQPKRVKTMVVKPDGSMVLREQPAAPAVEAAPAENAQVEAAKPVAPAAEPEVTFTPPAASEKPVVEVAAVEPEAPVAAKVAEPVDTVEAAIAEPVAPKPAKAVKKPVQKAKKPEPAPEQVALAEPEAAAPATGGGWSIQIASQPSKDGAQASYKSLASKFGSIIGGKGVQIIPAQIEGKGTFYRVRIPAGSKEEAAALCARYKSAGGSCFPSR